MITLKNKLKDTEATSVKSKAFNSQDQEAQANTSIFQNYKFKINTSDENDSYNDSGNLRNFTSSPSLSQIEENGPMEDDENFLQKSQQNSNGTENAECAEHISFGQESVEEVVSQNIQSTRRIDELKVSPTIEEEKDEQQTQRLI